MNTQKAFCFTKPLANGITFRQTITQNSDCWHIDNDLPDYLPESTNFRFMRECYKNYKITFKEASVGVHRWYFYHKSLTGPTDNRQGYAVSLDAAKNEIDEYKKLNAANT